MKVNFYVEDMLFFRYIGCSTVAKTLYNTLRGLPGLEVTWKKYGNSADIVHYHTFGPFAGLNRRLSRGKKILTAHSTPRINMENIALARAVNKRYPHIYRRFDHIITISRPCHEEVTAMVPDMPVTLIPNGVDREFFHKDEENGAAFREDYGIPEERKVVLTVAQQTPRKGLYDFLALSRLCPDTTFVWIGASPTGHFPRITTRSRCSNCDAEKTSCSLATSTTSSGRTALPTSSSCRPMQRPSGS